MSFEPSTVMTGGAPALELQWVFRTLWRRRLLAGALFGAVLLAVGVYTAVATPLYEATSLLLEGSQAVVASITLGTPPPGCEAPLAELLGRDIGFTEAADAVSAAAQAWPGTWTALADPGRFLDASRPHEARFRSGEWTWRR